jgi:uncharacterized protein
VKRKQLENLVSWYNKKNRKPLVLWGARQVGKTYLVKDLFAKSYFKDFVYIDLKKDDEANDFFSTTCDPTKYLKYIEARYEKKISNETPLIFDEVQQCHQVLTSLKYFKQDYPNLPVIATGSMVRLSLRQSSTSKNNNDSFLFPVGAIDSINIYPLTFEEYLLNTNTILLDRIKTAYKNKEALNPYEHNLAFDYLYEYLTIGGLPEVVNTFLIDKSYVDAKNVLKEVYNNYLADMDTYNISSETILKTRNIYTNIFAQLNKENKNFKISQIDKNKSNRDYFNAYQWLEIAKIVYRSRNLTGKITLPIIQENEGLFRLYLSDIGMFSYQSKTSQSDFFVKDKRNTLSGIFYENYVATEFASKDIPLYYWTGKNYNEFEFVVENNGKIIPIDVKKGSGKLNSLEAFRLANGKSTAVKISTNGFGYDKLQDILTIPLYEVFLLANDLANNLILI